MKNRVKKYTIISLSIVALLILVIWICNSGFFTPLHKYKSNTKKILDDYFNSNINSEQTIEKLEIIKQQSDSEYNKNQDSSYFSLSINISRIIYDINHNNITEIKKMYNELK